MKTQQKILGKIGEFVTKYYYVIIIIAVLMTGVSYFLLNKLGLVTDYMELMPDDIPSVKNIREVQKNMGGLGFLYFVLYYDNDIVKKNLQIQKTFQKELDRRLDEYKKKSEQESLSSKDIKEGKKKIKEDFDKINSFKNADNKIISIPPINKEQILKIVEASFWDQKDVNKLPNTLDEIDKAIIVMKSEEDKEYENKRKLNASNEIEDEKPGKVGKVRRNNKKPAKNRKTNIIQKNNEKVSSDGKVKNQNKEQEKEYYPEEEVTKAKIIFREIEKAALLVKNKNKYSDKEYKRAFYITNIINNVPVNEIERIKLKPSEERQLVQNDIDYVDIKNIKDKINLKPKDVEKYFFTSKDKEELLKINYEKPSFADLKKLNDILTKKWMENAKRLTERLVLEFKKFIGKDYSREKNDLIRYIDYKVDYKFLKDNALLMMDTEDVEKIMSLTNKGQLDEEYSTFEEIFSRYSNTSMLGDKEYLVDADRKILLFFVKPLSQSTDTNDTQYLMNQLNLIKLTLYKNYKEVEKDISFIEKQNEDEIIIEKANLNIRKNYPDTLIEHSGGYKLSLDQRLTVQQDLVKTSIIALIFIALALVIFFRRLSYMIYIMLGLSIGMMLTFGFAYLSIGYLNIITGFLLAVLTGLGVDFGVHFIARFREERQLGKDKKEAIKITFQTTGMGSLTSLITTVGGFYALCVSGFKGFSQYGLIAGSGLIFTALAMYFVLASLLMVFIRKNQSKFFADKVMHVDDIKNFYDPNRKYKYAKPILIGGIIITIVLGIIGLFVEFEWNSKNLEKWGQISIKVEEDVQREFNVSPDPAIFTTYSYDISKSNEPTYELYRILKADTKLARKRLEEAQEKFNDAETKYETTDEKYISAKNALEKAKKEYEYSLYVTRKYKFKKKYRIDDVDLTKLTVDEQKTLKKLQEEFDKIAEEYIPSDDKYIKAEKKLQDAIKKIAGDPKSDKVLSICDIIKPLEHQLANIKAIEKNREVFLTNIDEELEKDDLDKDEREYLEDFRALIQNTTKPITIDDLPEILKIRFLGKDINKRNNFFTYIYPKATIWDGRIIREYILQISQIEIENKNKKKETLYPTGVHALYKDIMYLVLDEGAILIPIVLLVVFLLLIIDFRNIKAAIITLIPLICGLLWTLGIMSLFEIRFNYMNLLVFAIVIGMGIDNGVHIYHRFIQTNSVYVTVMKTGGAALICSVTTILGWSALLFANYRGLNSMGIVAAIGMASCLICSLTIEPAILQLLKDKKEKKLNS